jgi:hypothetical protein
MVRNSVISIFVSLAVLFAAARSSVLASPAADSDAVSAGFLFDQFKLTLTEGERTEAAGPFYYSEKNIEDQTVAYPPFFSRYEDPAVNTTEYQVLYPLLNCEHYGGEWRWQFAQMLSFAGGRQPDETLTHRFTLFPFYFQQRSAETKLDYTAVFPFYGHLQNRLFRDKIYFVMFPLYGQSQHKDIVTDNYLYPIVHVRHGEGLQGWQVWPVAGHEHKVITQETNGFGDVSLNPGYDKSFLFWPLWLRQDSGLGTADPDNFRASIPLFVKERSPLRDQTSVLWPVFTWVEERGRKYHEWEGPWPFVIFARGEGKTTSRVWPIFSESHNATQESDSYLWPLYRYKRLHADPLDQQRRSVLFYLYVNVLERNTGTGTHEQRISLWPLYTWNRDFNGNRRLQVLAPLEVVLPTNRGLLRNWSPLWSLWRAEANPLSGSESQSFLWNLYRREASPGQKKISLLFGLFQYQREGAYHQTHLFYLNISGRPAPAT